MSVPGVGGLEGNLLGVDPGRDKCGLAIMSPSRAVLARSIVSRSDLWKVVQAMLDGFGVAAAIVGDRTGSAAVHREISTACQARGLPCALVNEHRSTQEGKLRYFQENPPRGWRRLLPRAWLTPPEPFDDWVAVVLAEAWLKDPSQPPS